MRYARQVAAAVTLALATCLLLIVSGVPASAATFTSVDSGGSTDGSAPVALASTGLNIALPVIIGLATLAAGIALVSWAFLRRGSSRRKTH